MRSIGPYAIVVRQVWLGHIGVVSYSLYLWQQLSTGAPALLGYQPLLSLPLFFIVPALAVYFAIEKPLIAAGQRLSSELKTRGRSLQPIGNAAASDERRRSEHLSSPEKAS